MTKKEIIERKIFLKKQLIIITENEIKSLEDKLKKADRVAPEKAELTGPSA